MAAFSEFVLTKKSKNHFVPQKIGSIFCICFIQKIQKLRLMFVVIND
jgi:hypothetical protein